MANKFLEQLIINDNNNDHNQLVDESLSSTENKFVIYNNIMIALAMIREKCSLTPDCKEN